MEISRLVAVFEADTSNFDAGSRRVSSGLQESERNATGASSSFSNLDSKLKSIGGGMQAVGASLTAGITLPIAGIGYAILSAGAEYETALNTLQGVTQATAEEMKLAGETAKALGADVSLPATSAKDAALAMLELGKAGLTVTQAMEASKGVLQLAAAGQLDEARAAEITANALNSFSLAATDSIRVSDLLAAAANASSAGVGDIAAALSQSGASYAAAKVPIEDLTASIGLLANAGIKGSDAGTSLKTFLSSITAPSTAGAEAMEKLGVSVFDATGTFKGMPTVIGEFEKALSGLTDEAKVGAIQKIFGADASRAAQILFKNGADGFAAMKTAVTQTGAAADLAASQTKGLGGAWEALKSQLETIGIDIYDRIAPTLTQIAQVAAQVVGQIGNAFTQLSPSLQIAAIAFAGIAAAIGPVLLVVGTLISAIGSIGTALAGVAAFAGFATLGAAFSAILPFILPVVAAVAAVGLAAVALYAAWQSNFGGIQETTQTVFNAVKDAVSTAMEAVSGIVSDIGGGMVNWWRQNYPLIQQTVATVSNAIKTIVANFLAAIKGFWEAHGGQISGVVKSIWDTIKAIVTPVMQIIGNVIKLGMQVINGDWSGAWATLLKIISQAVASVVAYFREMSAKSGQLLIALVGVIAKFSVDAAFAMLKGIKDGVVWVVEALASLPAKIISLIPVMIAAGANIGSAIWKGLKDGLAGAAASAPVPAQIRGMDGFMKGDSPSTGGGGFRYTSLAQFNQANDTNTLANPFTGVSAAGSAAAAAASAATAGVKNLTGATGGLNKGLKDTAKTAKEISEISFDNLLKAMRIGTAKQETGGTRNPLSASNGRTGASGMFQVMPANIPVWTANTPGVGKMSVAEFKKDANAQILVYNKYMGDYLRKALKQSSGDWQEAVRRAAAAWYGGEGNMKNFTANFGGKGNEPTFNKYTGNVLRNTKAALGKDTGKAEFDFGSITAQANPAAEAIAGFADQYARLNVTTREGEVRLDILKGKYGSLTPAIEKMLIASAAQMDMADISKASFDSNTDALTKLNDAFVAPQTEIEKLNDLLRLTSDSPEEIARFNGVTDALSKMAAQAKLTAAEFGAMLRLKALVTDDVLPTFEAGAGRGIAGRGIGTDAGGKSTVPEMPKFEMPPPPLAPWETFWGGIIAGMQRVQGSLPSVRQSLQGVLIDLPSRAADIFAGSIAKFDGTLKGFFKSVVAGFAQMVKEILIEQLRLQIIKGITKIIGAVAGGIGGGGGGGLTTSPSLLMSSIGTRATGGPVEANRPYMVGEREPELFVPKTSGRIYNGAQMAEMGGKTVVNNSNNFNFYPDPKTGNFPKESAVQAAKRMAALTDQAKRRA